MDTAQSLKMDPEVKAKVVAALTSGEYEQAKGYLRRTKSIKDGVVTEGFCCLGVVCDQYRKVTGIGEWETNRSRFGALFIVPGVAIPDTTDLPKVVQEWAGLTSDEVRSELARKNDSTWTFTDIATWIDENL